jgi:hypothetical protein
MTLLAATARTSNPSLLKALIPIFVLGIVIDCVSEAIGVVRIPLGHIQVTLLPLIWAVLLGTCISAATMHSGRALAMTPEKQALANSVVQIGLMIYIAQLALLVGPALPKIVSAGWGFIFQEFGHFVGTAIFGMPVALLFGIKREAVGATFSVGREPSLAIISEKYGIDSPEGRGVMAEYITGTVVGALFMSIVAGVVASTGWFSPNALGMAAGVGSGSMMAAITGAVTANLSSEVAKEVTAFAAAANLLTTSFGVYFTLLISLPFANLAYRYLEPILGAFAKREVRTVSHSDGAHQQKFSLNFAASAAVLIVIVAISLLTSNWFTYKNHPADAWLGALVVIGIALLGMFIKHILPIKIPAIVWVTIIGMLASSPIWPGSEWVVSQSAHVNFLAVATLVLAYAGLALGQNLGNFRMLGWRIVVVSLLANSGTFFGALIIAQIFAH